MPLMKNIYILLFSFLTFGTYQFSYCQTINSTTYPFSSSSGVVLEDMSSGTTQLVGANSDDGTSGLVNIGFTFYYVGVAYSQFDASANGYIKLGATVTNAGSTTDYTNSIASSNQNPAIAPYWDDLHTGVTTGKVHYKVIGSSPNQKLIIEWLNMQVPWVGPGMAGAATFQLWLTEGTGQIDFVYGSGMAANTANAGASIGINKSASVFASITSSANTCSYSVANDFNTVAITAGTKYSFIAPGTTPAAPTTVSFTSVTQSSMNVNWIDNSTNETFFIIRRSLSSGGPFVQVGTVISTSLATTGNAYSFNSTGLAANTTYYYQVEAANENSAPSADLTANQTTNPKAITVVPIIIEYFRGNNVVNGHLLNWKISCTNSPSAKMTLEHSADGRDFTILNVTTATAVQCLQPFNYLNIVPLSGINYYRLK